MSNSILLTSSILLGFFHIFLLLYYQQYNYLLIFTIISGITTSVWNHSTTSNVAKYFDRIVIFICFFIDMYLIYNINNNFIKFLFCNINIILSVIFYIISKLYNISYNNYNRNIFHLLSHVFITITHFILIEII